MFKRKGEKPRLVEMLHPYKNKLVLRDPDQIRDDSIYRLAYSPMRASEQETIFLFAKGDETKREAAIAVYRQYEPIIGKRYDVFQRFMAEACKEEPNQIIYDELARSLISDVTFAIIKHAPPR